MISIYGYPYGYPYGYQKAFVSDPARFQKNALKYEKNNKHSPKKRFFIDLVQNRI